jgi:UDP-N-acetylglucosamine:LPS N-acetylglucosamine transferase
MPITAPSHALTEVGPLVAKWFGEAATQSALSLTRIGRSTSSVDATALANVARDADRLHVLVYSADLGGGHDAMANAIRGEILTRYGREATVDVRNGLQVGNPVLHRMMRNGYEAQLKYAPGSYTLMYDALANPTVAHIGEGVTSALTAPRLLRDIQASRPDVVVSTFPHVTATLGNLRATGRLKVPAFGVVIDSKPHAAWVHPGIDEHLVLNPSDVGRIAKFGSRADPIRGMAIRPPVDPRSFEPVDRTAARAAFGLPQDQKVLLVSGGSWGLALPDAELQRILDITDLHLAVATGRNTDALAHLQQAFDPARVTAIPFTKEMPSLLAASDGVLTNSAGMTTMETFARGRPVVLYRPVAGHGVDGAAALDQDGLATFARTPEDAINVLRRIDAGDDADLAARVANARSLFDGPRASDVIVGAAVAGRDVGRVSHT